MKALNLVTVRRERSRQFQKVSTHIDECLPNVAPPVLGTEVSLADRETDSGGRALEPQTDQGQVINR